MADNNLETMLRNQLQAGLVNALDSATQAGDIQAARKAAQQLSEFAAQNKPDTQQFTNADIREALKAKAPWFGIDPIRSGKVVEFGKNMEPQSFPSADAFADKLIETINKEFKEMEDGEEDEDEEIEESKDDEKEEKKVTRRKTDAPTGITARAVPRKSSGPWTKLGDAPKEIAETIRHSTDKYTRTATKEQREKYIATALATAYAADQRARGKK